MTVGPKTRRYFALKNHPQKELITESLNTVEALAEEKGTKAALTFLQNAKTDLEKRLGILYAWAEDTLRKLAPILQTEFARMVQEHLDSVPHIKGDPGYTPVKGKDYVDGEPGAPGATPQPDVHYLSIETTRKEIGQAHVALYEKMAEEGMTPAQMQANMQDMFDSLDVAKLARKMEELKEADKLDYNMGLKNKPQAEAGKPHGAILHRGGSSKQTYYYDLSDQCDGNTKAFAIPVNARVVAVSCTDAPSGVYRPLVDWVGSGTMLLTLDANVPAPSVGATLYILYVQ